MREGARCRSCLRRSGPIAALALAAACGGGPFAVEPAGGGGPGGGKAGAPAPIAAASADVAGPAPARLLGRWLSSFNAGDLARHAVFHAEHVSPDARAGASPEEAAEGELDVLDAVGGFDLHRTIVSSATEVRASLRERGGLGWSEVAIAVDAAKPDTIASMRLRHVPTPEGQLPVREGAEALGRDVDRLLQRLAGEGRFSGVVLMAKDGAPFFEGAYGYADREKKAPNDVDTKFRVGSLNKMFTSVAVAQLVQKKKLAYADTVAKLLPDYPDKDVAAKATLHHLLTHTSGLGDYVGPEFFSKKETLRRLSDYLPFFAGKPLAFEPGAGWAYSNAGMLVAGLIVERRSGETYFDYVREHIYRPAGMASSDCYEKTRPQPNQSVGYTKRGRRWASNYDMLPLMGGPAGGCDSTARDLLRFDRALRGHALVNAALTAEITAGKVAMRPDRKYAYGFGESLVDGKRVVGHTGGSAGMNASFEMYLDSGYTVIVLSNLDPPIAERVSQYIQERIRQ